MRTDEKQKIDDELFSLHEKISLQKSDELRERAHQNFVERVKERARQGYNVSRYMPYIDKDFYAPVFKKKETKH